MQGWQYKIVKHTLQFSVPAITSRGALSERPTWFLLLQHSDLDVCGVGEFGVITGLSPEDSPYLEFQAEQEISNWVSRLPPPFLQLNESDRGYHISQHIGAHLPSVRFAAEVAWQDLASGGNQLLYPGSFTEGETSVPVNGLIWMGTMAEMEKQVAEKIARGFKTLKLKISDENWDQELELIKKIRRNYAANTLTIRVDANGAFSLRKARTIMADLQSLGIHSIEQPLKAGLADQLASLCKHHDMPVALDEELIGVQPTERQALLDSLQPKYLVLKPSLLGGLYACRNWIKLAEKNNIGWWLTSALESNVGLNAIAQYAAHLNVAIPQGLGTGQLYDNNIPCPLYLNGEQMFFKKDGKFQWPVELQAPPIQK